MKSKPPPLKGPYRNMETIPEVQVENTANENIPPQPHENQNPNQETTSTSSSNENFDTRNPADRTITQSETSNSCSSVSSPKNQRPFTIQNNSSSKSSSLRVLNCLLPVHFRSTKSTKIELISSYCYSSYSL